MDKKKKVLDDQGRGSLVRGIKVVDTVLKDFKMRPPGGGDIFDAEEIAPGARPIAFKVALAGICIEQLGDLKGPIDFELMRRLHPDDITLLMNAVDEAAELGNAG